MKNRKGYKKGGSTSIKMPNAPVLTTSDKGKGTAGPRPKQAPGGPNQAPGGPRSGMGRPGAGPRPGMGRPAVRPSKPAINKMAKPVKPSGPRPGLGRPLKGRPLKGRPGLGGSLKGRPGAGPRAVKSRPMKRFGRAEGGMVDFGSIFEMEKKSGK